MIAQGTDGVSCGVLNEGTMSREDMLSFVPLHLSAREASPTLEDWQGHDIDGGAYSDNGLWYPHLKPGIFVWEPPPAAASTAVEELHKAQHKQQVSTHIVLIPRLITPYWHRALYKAVGILIEIPAGQTFWLSNCYKPLLLGFTFPYLLFRPWQIQQAPALLGLERNLRQVSEEEGGSEIPILHKLWDFQRSLCTMSKDMVHSLPQDESRITIPTGLNKDMRLSKDLGIKPNYPVCGPWPIEDNVGFTVALEILRASVEPGSYLKHSQRFDTVRRLQSTFASTFSSSVRTHTAALHFEGDRGYYLLICFVGLLKGNEGFMMELQGLLQHILNGKKEPKDLRHIAIPLLGEFKEEQGEKWHLLLLADETVSGFKPRL
eukprot:14659213-Ditylum_brightwellii.AAC.2